MLRREKGFTLIELLIVVAIIGIIAAIAVPNLLTAIQRSKRSRTVADMRAIGTAVGTYLVDHNAYPRSTSTDFENVNVDSNLSRSYYDGATKDAWSTAFNYVSDGEEYTLTSYGKDRGPAGAGNEFNSDVVYYNGQFYAPEAIVER
jgi:general secretion pathway protein G